MTEDTNIERGKIARKLAYGGWLSLVKMDNPGISKEDIAARWQDEKDRQIRYGRKALKALEKSGYKVVPDQ